MNTPLNPENCCASSKWEGHVKRTTSTKIRERQAPRSTPGAQLRLRERSSFRITAAAAPMRPTDMGGTGSHLATRATRLSPRNRWVERASSLRNPNGVVANNWFCSRFFFGSPLLKMNRTKNKHNEKKNKLGEDCEVVPLALSKLSP